MSDPFPVDDAWWMKLYDELLAELLLVRRDPGHTRATIDFLERVLGLTGRARVFDQCCGIGSLAVPLGLRGYDVVGVDLIEAYIQRASAKADAARVELDLHVADAARFVPLEPVHGAFNWATSFGYFPSDQENLGMLESAFRALEPGGLYALDFMNVPQVLADFLPVMVTRRDTTYGEVVLTRDSVVGAKGRWLFKTWSYRLPDGREQVQRSRVRLYKPDAVARLMGAAGFVHVATYGDVDGQPITDASPRCITVGRRP